MTRNEARNEVNYALDHIDDAMHAVSDRDLIDGWYLCNRKSVTGIKIKAELIRRKIAA